MVTKYKFKTEPYAHQKEALTLSWDKQSFALFMEMGTGKTKVLLDNLGTLRCQNLINGALIIAPNSKTFECCIRYVDVEKYIKRRNTS